MLGLHRNDEKSLNADLIHHCPIDASGPKQPSVRLIGKKLCHTPNNSILLQRSFQSTASISPSPSQYSHEQQPECVFIDIDQTLVEVGISTESDAICASRQVCGGDEPDGVIELC